MKKPILASLAAIALTIPTVAFAAGGDTSTSTATTTPPSSSYTPPCTPMKRLLSTKHWRDAHPLRGENPCSSPNARKLREHFYLYREYRKVTPYRCQKGTYGTWAIPCYIIACESHFSWSAANPSGAVGPYQLLGWGAPYPARTFRAQVENHRIAHSLSLSNWVCF